MDKNLCRNVEVTSENFGKKLGINTERNRRLGNFSIETRIRAAGSNMFVNDRDRV